MKIVVKKKAPVIRLPKPVEAEAVSMPQPKPESEQPSSPLSGDEYRIFFENMYDAVLLVDGEGRIRAANKRAAAFFGYEPSELCVMSIYDIVSGFDRDMFGKLSEHIFSGRYSVINASCIRKDKRAFAASIALSEVLVGDSRGLAFAIRSLASE